MYNVHKKTISIQNINPRAAFTIIVLLMIAWVLARPLKGIGEAACLFLGGIINNAYESVTHANVSVKDFLESKKIQQEQNKTISLLKIKLKHSEDENKKLENLKNILKLKQKVSYKTFYASVIARGSDSWHKQIIIDKGINEMIMTGDTVLTHNGVVGQVVEVNRNSSIVQLISDPGFNLGCKISKRNITGILSGLTNKIGLLEFIPVGSNIMVGDPVVTSGIKPAGLLPAYPAGHPVGKISKISKKKNKGTDLYVEVKLSENLNNLRDVLVFSPG